MHRKYVLALLSVCAVATFAQSDRGTITGTISDPAGAVVANAAVEAKNTDTGAVYPVAASETGNYTAAQLPSGTYQISVTVPGFKKFVRSGLAVQAAQTIRVDATLEVGSATESVTVTGEATLLKTESGELSNTVATQTMDTLPLLSVGQNSSGIRNPFNIVAMLPGAFYQPSPSFTGPTVRINGGVAGSEKVLVDGMDGTNILGQGANQQNQPGMDSIQEWTVQTSNYAAEFGQAGSSVMNITMKSGGNQFHGGLYEYFQDEFLNAGQPFTNNGNGGLLRPTQRRNDYGLTLGGPVAIPKVYNGRDKTFFFFSWEQFLQNQNFLPGAFSIPTQAYRNGDFGAAITAVGARNLGTDLLGRPIIANTIYDPNTRQIVNGQAITSPFMNNQIPLGRMDPVALKIQKMLPLPFCVAGPPCNAAGVVNNFQNVEPVSRDTEAPSLKIDQNMGPKDKLSFFWARTMTYTQSGYGEDGLPQPISYTFGGGIYSHRERLNYDHTITPTLLLHLGAGYDTDYLGRPSVTPDYDACAGISLCSQSFQRPATFPSFTGLSDATAGGFGSTAEPQIGPPGRADNVYSIVDSIASLTWVKGNHTFKFGGNAEFQGSYTITVSNLQGTYGFSSAQTAMPYEVNTSTGTSTANIGANHIGFPYASFLLGAVDNAEVDPPSRVRFGKQQWGFYAQDSWKVTRKLTLDLGLRYDYSTWYKEQYGRSANLAPNLADPTAGGHPGAAIYQATCACSFASNYPWGFGPRFGFAYQVLPKTVLRGGFGIEYTGTGVAQVFGAASGNAAANNRFAPSSIPGNPIMTLGQGVTLNGAPLTTAQIAWPNLSSGFYPVGGVIPGAGPQYYDPNAGRPARQYQWSFSVQRELARNLVVQASYIGNRGIWWPTYVGSALTNYNDLSTALLNQYGINLNSQADLAMLLAPIGSAGAKQFQNKLPFANFPVTASVAQSLRPFPQYTTISLVNPPLGDSWYNSLQLTANKRFSNGLQFDYAFTWSKSMDTFGGTPDVENRSLAKAISSLDQPLVMRIGLSYITPKAGPKALSYLVRDWMFNPFLYYASGTLIAAPAANATGYPSALSTGTIGNLTFQTGQYQLRTGQPLYLKDLNCHCFDPYNTFVLNPAAWADPAPGQYGGPEYSGDYRGARRPVENLAFGRQFRIREGMSLNIRAEFTNIFNRTYLNNPTISGVGISPQAAPVCKLPSGSNGACSTPGLQIVSGFGSINQSTTQYPPRTGQLVAQFRF
ncbi:MAG TPA: TonB-dependent receptor [Bryobacteraceae bacterium]|jgi:hypothetical protein